MKHLGSQKPGLGKEIKGYSLISPHGRNEFQDSGEMGIQFLLGLFSMVEHLLGLLAVQCSHCGAILHTEKNFITLNLNTAFPTSLGSYCWLEVHASHVYLTKGNITPHPRLLPGSLNHML